MEPRPCAEFGGVFGATPNATIVEVVFADHDGVCAVAADHDFCGVQASARRAYVAVGRANVYGGPLSATRRTPPAARRRRAAPR
jgi:hypothetical protein